MAGGYIKTHLVKIVYIRGFREPHLKTLSLLPSAAGAILLTACAASGPATAPASATPPEPVFQCNADGARFAVGQQLSPQLEAAARVRAGAGLVRALKPGQVVTMELNGARLNLDVDARGRVTDVRCG